MWHALDPVLTNQFTDGGVGERVATGGGEDQGVVRSGLLGIFQERQGPGGQGHSMLFAGFGAGRRNRPHLFGDIDFRPFRQPNLAGTGRG